MAATDAPVVCDAGPIIHLDELGCLDLLTDFSPLLVPEVVWNEVTRYRAHLVPADLPDARIVPVPVGGSERLATFSASLGLHLGERATIALMEQVGARLLLCDDSAARLAAESLGFEVRGTLGVVVRSIRRQRRTREQVLTLLRDLPRQSTLHVSVKLLQTVIGQVESD